MGARAGRGGRAGAAAQRVSLSRKDAALFRRPFAGPAAAPRARICPSGAGRLGEARRRGAFLRPPSVGELSRTADRPDRAPGGSEAARSGGDEYAFGEPASPDGLLLPA